ncbi:MAG TPA: preprotein translocase subunit YajC [Kofleriaceae bacterium]|jgi:preprotein translocase subunit YajC|nr:preprotein translocase subunit YajC [Kofleriaceae bacterium]
MSNAASPIVMMLVMFAIFYFILIRPQSKRQKEHQAMLGKLGKGDEVITRGGMIGKITGVSDDNILVIELQEKVRVRVPRAYVEGKWEGKVPANAANSSAA